MNQVLKIALIHRLYYVIINNGLGELIQFMNFINFYSRLFIQISET